MKITSKLMLGATLLWAFGLAAQQGGTPAPAPSAPDTVTISELSDWFGEVTFPHGAHASLSGDCAGCHHHGDGEVQPCRICHPASAVLDASAPPPLNQAFHKQCVGCHREAGAGPVACEDCHARRRLPAGPALKGAHP